LNGDGVRDWHDLEVESERIRLLVDTNGDGHADVATTLAEGFDGITSGVAGWSTGAPRRRVVHLHSGRVEDFE
jgi:hypothetical protein